MPRAFMSHGDLRDFMSYLQNESCKKGLHDFATALGNVLTTPWTTSSEFLGETRLVLQGYRETVKQHFSSDDYESVDAALTAIRAAWDSANG